MRKGLREDLVFTLVAIGVISVGLIVTVLISTSTEPEMQQDSVSCSPASCSSSFSFDVRRLVPSTAGVEVSYTIENRTRTQNWCFPEDAKEGHSLFLPLKPEQFLLLELNSPYSRNLSRIGLYRVSILDMDASHFTGSRIMDYRLTIYRTCSRNATRVLDVKSSIHLDDEGIYAPQGEACGPICYRESIRLR